MKVVGVGCGPGMLTEQAIAAISTATIILGSKRAIALALDYIPKGCLVQEMTVFRPETPIPDDAVVLSTGDPQLAGLGYLGGEIIPGISSLQVTAARLGIPLELVSVVDVHGKGHAKAAARVVAEVKAEKIVFVIADPRFSPGLLVPAFAGLEREIFVAICEDLGYPGESIQVGTLADPPVPASKLFSVMVGRVGQVPLKIPPSQ